MRWALNNEIEDLSKKVNNPLKDEKYGVCQNIKTFLTGVERCTSSDVANVNRQQTEGTFSIRARLFKARLALILG